MRSERLKISQFKLVANKCAWESRRFSSGSVRVSPQVHKSTQRRKHRCCCHAAVSWINESVFSCHCAFYSTSWFVSQVSLFYYGCSRILSLSFARLKAAKPVSPGSGTQKFQVIKQCINQNAVTGDWVRSRKCPTYLLYVFANLTLVTHCHYADRIYHTTGCRPLFHFVCTSVIELTWIIAPHCIFAPTGLQFSRLVIPCLKTLKEKNLKHAVKRSWIIGRRNLRY